MASNASPQPSSQLSKKSLKPGTTRVLGGNVTRSLSQNSKQQVKGNLSPDTSLNSSQSSSICSSHPSMGSQGRQSSTVKNLSRANNSRPSVTLSKRGKKKEDAENDKPTGTHIPQTDSNDLYCDGCHGTRTRSLVQCELCKNWLCPRCANLEAKVIKDIGKWSTIHFFCMTCDLEAKLKLHTPYTSMKSDEIIVPPSPNQANHVTGPQTDHFKPVLDMMQRIETKIMKLENDNEQLKADLHHLSYRSPLPVPENACPRTWGPVANTPAHQKTENSPQDAIPDAIPILEEYRDRDRRRNNIILHNVEESKSETKHKRQEDDQQFVLKILTVLQFKNINIVKTTRLGYKQRDNSIPRILLVQLAVPRDEILFKAKMLRHHGVYNKIFIDPDRTPDERKTHKLLRDELKKRRADGEKCIIRGGRIVHVRDTNYHFSYSSPYSSGSASSQAKQPAAVEVVDISSDEEVHLKTTPPTTVREKEEHVSFPQLHDNKQNADSQKSGMLRILKRKEGYSFAVQTDVSKLDHAIPADVSDHSNLNEAESHTMGAALLDNGPRPIAAATNNASIPVTGKQKDQAPLSRPHSPNHESEAHPDLKSQQATEDNSSKEL